MLTQWFQKVQLADSLQARFHGSTQRGHPPPSCLCTLWAPTVTKEMGFKGGGWAPVKGFCTLPTMQEQVAAARSLTLFPIHSPCLEKLQHLLVFRETGSRTGGAVLCKDPFSWSVLRGLPFFLLLLSHKVLTSFVLQILLFC